MAPRPALRIVSAADETKFAASTDVAMRVLHDISREIPEASQRDVRRMVDRLVDATAGLRALEGVGRRTRVDPSSVLAGGIGPLTSLRTTFAALTGDSPLSYAAKYPDSAFMRPERLRRDHDLVGWDCSKAKPGAVYVIAGNWESSLFSGFTASRIAKRMNVASPVVAADLETVKNKLTAQPSNVTAMAAVGVREGNALNYAHFPKVAPSQAFELARQLAAHYGGTREVYVTCALSNDREHRTLPFAPPLRTELSEPELVSPTADGAWVAAKRTAFQNACDGQQTVFGSQEPGVGPRNVVATRSWRDHGNRHPAASVALGLDPLDDRRHQGASSAVFADHSSEPHPHLVAQRWPQSDRRADARDASRASSLRSLQRAPR